MRLREKRAFYARFIVALPAHRVVDRVEVGEALRVALFGSSKVVGVSNSDIAAARRFVAKVREREAKG